MVSWCPYIKKGSSNFDAIHGKFELRHILCRQKTTGELGLSFLAYNLRRAINMVGTKRLIEAMKA
jgi:hypothetical protein